MKENLDIHSVKPEESINLSFMDNKVPAGFPSPAQDCDSDSIDLNRELIRRPSSTFCARVRGDSMIDCGIDDGDLIVIDKALTPHNGSIAVCFVDGDFTVKRIAIKSDGIYLMPANSRYQPMKVPEGSNFQVWGIVTHIIKSVSNEE